MRYSLISSVVFSVCLTSSSFAHLAIVRQGPESRGVRELGDQHGRVLASGDFDNDGYADLAVGVSWEDITTATGTVTNAGAVVISYGSPTGLTPSGAQIFTQGNLGYTSESFDEFGAALVVGDFNGDGFDDLAIGSPKEDFSGISDAGNVIIVYGSIGGLDASATILFSQGNSVGNPEDDDGFGSALAAGDFNGDGRDDLAVGIPGEDLEIGVVTLSNVGAVQFFFGGAGGLTSSGSYIFTDNDTPGGAQVGAAFGSSLAAGNFDGDAYDDLGVGAPETDVLVVSDAGAVYAYFGSNGGVTAGSVFMVLAEQLFAGATIMDGNFGASLATGYLGDDAFADLAIGMPGYESSPDFAETGAAFVLYGRLDGLDSNDSSVHRLSGLIGANGGERLGASIDCGDWSGDGIDDLAVGMPGDFVAGVPAAGRVLVINSDEDGVPTFLETITQLDQGSHFETPEPGDVHGTAIAFGAFAGGSREGLAAGAPGEDANPAPGTGEAVVVNAGSVHIHMPWKQPNNLSCRTALVTDCDLNIVFSVKPYDRHAIASVTKTMTCLLAAEATQAGCSPCVDYENDIYVLPNVFDTPANGGTIGGSLANMCTGESGNLELMMHGLMLRSGNETAHAIADMVGTPGTTCANTGCNDIPVFIQMMNDRAAELGMTRTSYTNASGGIHGNFWPSPNLSTAEDLAILGHAAMLNDRVRGITQTTSVDFIRFNGCASPNGVIQTWNTGIFVVEGAGGASFPNGIGIKPGGNGLASSTFLAAVDHPDGRLYAVVLGAPGGNRTCGGWGNVANRSCDILSQLTFATNEYCTFPIAPTPAPAGSTITYAGVSSQASEGRSVGFPIGESEDQDVFVQVGLGDGSSSASARLVLDHDGCIFLGPGETLRWSLARFESHEGVTISNIGSTTALFDFSFNQPVQSGPEGLAPGGILRIPPYDAGSPQADATMIITNLSTVDTIDLEIQRSGFERSVDLMSGGEEEILWQLESTPRCPEESVNIALLGEDSMPGGTMDMLIANTRPADTDLDGDFDMREFGVFQRCFDTTTAQCLEWFDFDASQKIDLEDFRAFEELVTGP